MDRVSRYRKHAQDARDLAEREPHDEARRILHEIASHWDALADIHERQTPPDRRRP